MKRDHNTSSLLVMQLEDGSHRTVQWGYSIGEDTARMALADQQRSRLHTVVRAILFVGDAEPVTLLQVPGLPPSRYSVHRL